MVHKFLVKIFTMLIKLVCFIVHTRDGSVKLNELSGSNKSVVHVFAHCSTSWVW